jgi:hypothetical protein
MKLINIKWSPEKIKTFCETKDNWILKLDEDMTAGELKSLYEEHMNSPYCYDGIIAEIAAHNNSPVEVLEAISNSYKEDILSALATNVHLTPKIIKKLSTSHYPEVRIHVLHNKGTPIALVKRIAEKDKNKRVRETAKRILRGLV